jgi:hypothetical protein
MRKRDHHAPALFLPLLCFFFPTKFGSTSCACSGLCVRLSQRKDSSEEWRVPAEARCAQRYAQLAHGSPPGRREHHFSAAAMSAVCSNGKLRPQSVTVPAGPVRARGRHSFCIQLWLLMHPLPSGRAGPVPLQQHSRFPSQSLLFPGGEAALLAGGGAAVVVVPVGHCSRAATERLPRSAVAGRARLVTAEHAWVGPQAAAARLHAAAGLLRYAARRCGTRGMVQRFSAQQSPGRSAGRDVDAREM